MSAAATSAASTESSSPPNAMTTRPSQSRVLRSTLNIRTPSCFSSKAGARPGGEFTSFHDELYAYGPPTSYPGDAQ